MPYISAEGIGPNICIEPINEGHLLAIQKATRKEIASDLDDLAASTESCHDATLIHQIAKYVMEG